MKHYFSVARCFQNSLWYSKSEIWGISVYLHSDLIPKHKMCCILRQYFANEMVKLMRRHHAQILEKTINWVISVRFSQRFPATQFRRLHNCHKNCLQTRELHKTFRLDKESFQRHSDFCSAFLSFFFQKTAKAAFKVVLRAVQLKCSFSVLNLSAKSWLPCQI